MCISSGADSLWLQMAHFWGSCCVVPLPKGKSVPILSLFPSFHSLWEDQWHCGKGACQERSGPVKNASPAWQCPETCIPAAGAVLWEDTRLLSGLSLLNPMPSFCLAFLGPVCLSSLLPSFPWTLILYPHCPCNSELLLPLSCQTLPLLVSSHFLSLPMPSLSFPSATSFPSPLLNLEQPPWLCLSPFWANMPLRTPFPPSWAALPGFCRHLTMTLLVASDSPGWPDLLHVPHMILQSGVGLHTMMTTMLLSTALGNIMHSFQKTEGLYSYRARHLTALVTSCICGRFFLWTGPA